jgi:hypothetical protein
VCVCTPHPQDRLQKGARLLHEGLTD